MSTSTKWSRGDEKRFTALLGAFSRGTITEESLKEMRRLKIRRSLYFGAKMASRLGETKP